MTGLQTEKAWSIMKWLLPLGAGVIALVVKGTAGKLGLPAVLAALGAGFLVWGAIATLEAMAILWGAIPRKIDERTALLSELEFEEKQCFQSAFEVSLDRALCLRDPDESAELLENSRSRVRQLQRQIQDTQAASSSAAITAASLPSRK